MLVAPVHVCSSFKATASLQTETDPHSNVNHIRMCESACENWPRGAFTVQEKMHACLISLVLRARSHRDSTLWMFSLLCEHNAGWETVERTGVHLHSPSLRPLQFISRIGSGGGEWAESLQLHFKEVGAALERQQL